MTDVVLEKVCWDWEKEGSERWKITHSHSMKCGFLSTLLKYTLPTTHTISARRPWTAQSVLLDSCLLYLCLGVCDSFCTLYSDFQLQRALCVAGLCTEAELWLAENSELTRDWSGSFYRSQMGFDAELKPVWGANTHTPAHARFNISRMAVTVRINHLTVILLSGEFNSWLVRVRLEMLVCII